MFSIARLGELLHVEAPALHDVEEEPEAKFTRMEVPSVWCRSMHRGGNHRGGSAGVLVAVDVAVPHVLVDVLTTTPSRIGGLERYQKALLAR